MSEKRFYLENDEGMKYVYSEIREYVDEKHISIPLRNDELCKLLNEQQDTIKQLEGKIKRLNAFIVSKDLAIEYLKWNKEGDNDE